MFFFVETNDRCVVSAESFKLGRPMTYKELDNIQEYSVIFEASIFVNVIIAL
jgi:hypothetical protein